MVAEDDLLTVAGKLWRAVRPTGIVAVVEPSHLNIERPGLNQFIGEWEKHYLFPFCGCE